MESPRLGFPKSKRLRARPEFLAAQSAGVRVTTPHFVLIVAPGSVTEAPPRLGVTASKQVGNAVHRNRVKRLVREAFRLDSSVFPRGTDVVVIARAGAPELTRMQVTAEWDAVRGLVRKRTRRDRPPPGAPS